MPVRSPRWFIIASLLLAAPDTPGIIELWDDDELVYVGEAPESIRKRLVADLLEHNDWQETTHFGWEISFEPTLRREELLGEYEALHHRRPRFNEA